MSDIKVNGVTYRQRTRKCGNKKCKCATGEEHGPYWYAFSDGGTAKYIGLELPKEITGHLAKLKASGGKIKKLQESVQKQQVEFYGKYTETQRRINALRSLKAGDYVGAQVLADLGLKDLVFLGPRSEK